MADEPKGNIEDLPPDIRRAVEEVFAAREPTTGHLPGTGEPPPPLPDFPSRGSPKTPER